MKEEAKKFVQEFITEMNGQDNRMTATPYFYVIKTAHWVSSYHDGEGDRCTLIKDCETCACEKSEEEVFHSFRNEYEGETEEDSAKIKDMDDYDLKCWLEDNEYSIYWENHMWREEGCFFTESEAENHLKSNHYHYSQDAHTYVKHFWRAPNVKKFFKSVGILCGVEFDHK